MADMLSKCFTLKGIINSEKPIAEVVRDFDKVLRKYAMNIKDKSKTICVFGKRKYYDDSNN